MNTHTENQSIPVLPRTITDSATSIIADYHALFDVIARVDAELTLFEHRNPGAEQALLEWSARRGLTPNNCPITSGHATKVWPRGAAGHPITVWVYAKLVTP